MIPPFFEACARLRKRHEFDGVGFSGLTVLHGIAAVPGGCLDDSKVCQRCSADRARTRRALWILWCSIFSCVVLVLDGLHVDEEFLIDCSCLGVRPSWWSGDSWKVRLLRLSGCLIEVSQKFFAC